jgi:hypothetical protein
MHDNSRLCQDLIDTNSGSLEWWLNGELVKMADDGHMVYGQ